MHAARQTLKAVVGILGLTLVYGLIGVTTTRAASRPPHLQAAMDLVSAVQPSDTNYQHKDSVVHFPGDDGSNRAECRTDCSGLLDAVLKRAYGLKSAQLADWLDSKRPLATHYHEAIKAQHGFKNIAALQDVRAGDILAVKYPPGAKGGNTGHVMIVAGTPKQRSATTPVVENTLQWDVPVIDESESGHGTTDTRHRDDHTSVDGLGKGVLRIYTDREGRVAGYSWSNQKVSKFISQSSHNMVIGRVDLDFIHSLTKGGQ